MAQLDGVTQVSCITNEIDITWNSTGTYLLEVQEISVDKCPGLIRSGQVFVSTAPTFIPSADLSIIVTVDNTLPFIESTVVFTITATNIFPDGATGVTVPVILGTAYTYVSSSTTAGVYDPSSGVWTIGELNNETSEILTITLLVNPTGNYVNSVIIQGNETDGSLLNNNSWAETYPVDFIIPEGFSPNGDGINDLFVIRGIQNYPENTILIFNRWGNKVFEASHYVNTWDGRSTSGLNAGGNELPGGTYFYLLYLDDRLKVIKGTIYLNR